MDLVVVESGAKARTIQQYLGKEAVVAACRGHVQDLPTQGKEGKKAEWAAREDALPNPGWDWTEGGEKIVSGLLAKGRKSKVSRVLVATDPDREGEFIAARLADLLSPLGEVRRVRFQEITKGAIAAAMAAPTAIDQDLVDAAIVRKLLDRLVGFRASKFARSWKLRSMGRVQTPTLGFLVEREEAIAAFVPIAYHEARAQAGGVRYLARFHEPGDPAAWRDEKGKVAPHRTTDKALAQAACAAAKAAGALTLAEVEEKGRAVRPPLPFTTDTLLAAAGAALRWRPARVMKVAQGLYEAGHITYMRTDSTRTSPGARQRMRVAIADHWGEDHLGKGTGAGRPKSGVQDAHEAIRPSRPGVRTPAVGKEGGRLYALIWGRFAASQMAPARWRDRALKATAGEVVWEGKESWRLFAGWEAAAGKEAPAAPAGPAEPGLAVALDKGAGNPRLVTDKTKPPRRYTQHALVAKMKAAGIGRPSTYAATVQKLLDREYATDTGGSLTPSATGHLLWREVAGHYGATDSDEGLFAPGFTARMEATLDKIGAGGTAAAPAWAGFSARFRAIHAAALERKAASPTLRQMEFFASLRERVPPEQVAEVLAGREPDALTGQEMRAALDAMVAAAEASGLARGPSAKQLAFLATLAQDCSLEEEAAAALVGGTSFAALSMAAASDLIEALLERRPPPPPSPRQLATIRSLAKKSGLTEAAAVAKVDAAALADLTGGRQGTASKLIDLLKPKRRAGRRRAKT